MKALYLAALVTLALSMGSCKKCWKCTYPYPDSAMGDGVFEVCDKEYMKSIDGNIQTDANGNNPKEIKCKPFFK